MKNECTGISDATDPIGELKVVGLDGFVVLGFYHQRRFLPLMARVLPMFLVTPEERIPGFNVMAGPLLPDEEVERGVMAGLGPYHTPWPRLFRCGKSLSFSFFGIVFDCIFLG